MMDNLFKSFQLSTLCVAMLCANSAVFALEDLEKLDDYTLGEATGEGIAILPTDAFMVFRGATDVAETQANILSDRTKDTGYINYIPVGPLTLQAQTSGAGKADLYLYGIAISKADGNLNARLGSSPQIESWGTASNPWLLKVDTVTQVPNFSPTACAGGATGDDSACRVSLLSLEAPLHHNYALTYTDTSKNVANNIPTTGANGADAYKLKFAFWADAFVLDPTKSATDATRFDMGGTGRANRLRLQAVWDGMSLNGSRINVFQTLGGASTSNALGQIRDTSYNHTLGLSGLLRFNSGDTRNIKLTAGATNTTEATTYGVANGDGVSAGTGANAGWTVIHGGAETTLNANTAGTGCSNAGTGAFTSTGGCKYYVEARTRRDSKTSSQLWTVPTNIGVARFSTQETSNTALLSSPAIGSSTVAPTFATNEGLHLYGLNVNLVLGNLFQPIIFNKEATSNNFSMELARIPNKPEIYEKVYQDYDKTYGTTYKGSTCSVYYCGTPLQLGNTTYQGNTATHSSISIGSTNYNPNTGLMTAYTGNDAMGVSFGALQTQTTSNTTYSAVMKDVRYKERALYSTSWCGYRGGLALSCGNTRTSYSWRYYNAAGTLVDVPTMAVTGSSSACTGWSASACTNVNNNTYSGVDNRNWSNSTAAWRQGSNGEINTLIGAANGVTGTLPTTNQAPLPVLPTSLNNNLGSAVIDGLLIQHLKITTKGL